MQDPGADKELAMEETLASIREIMAEGRNAEPIPAASHAQTSGEEANAEGAGLLSSRTTAAIGSALDKLTVSIQQQKPSLEDVVRDALRPVLKSWLDENLPELVERIVQAEIERVIRRR
jgi:cell pole-organizing protein PopZ